MNRLLATKAIGNYIRKIRLLQPNARLYLLSTIILGLGMGIQRLLFNFYVLSQGYSEVFLGTLISINSLVALFGALPAGYVSDILGRKRAFLISGASSTLAIIGLVFWQQTLGIICMNVLLGLSHSLMWVTGAPFMMENSGEEERSYLFSLSFGLQTVASFLGNLIGGILPAWLAVTGGFDPESTTAYARALLLVSGSFALAMLPILLLKRHQIERTNQSLLDPFRYAWNNLPLLGKLLGPGLIISLGAGLLIPFRNIFYRNVYEQSDASIGRLFALGSLAMALGFLIAPPLADRIGKIRLVVLTQAISIPFLLLMGFAPWFELSALGFLVRGALMNMSNPIYQAFLMEHVEEKNRAMVVSLNSMGWNFGWMVSPQVSGWLQANYGFDPVYAGTTSTYILGTLFTYHFFIRKSPDKERLDAVP